MIETIDQFLASRNEAFRTLDIAWAKHRQPGMPDEVALIALHKARYECKALEDQLRQESRAWLEANNYTRLGNLPWPPKKELP